MDSSFSMDKARIHCQTREETGIAATRQLAKRQMTWMRSMQGTLLLNPDEKVASLAVLKKEAEQILSGLQQ